MHARERLNQLVELASCETPEERRTLALRLTDVLLDWPRDYPESKRESFAWLLEKVLLQLDDKTRRSVATRFVHRPDAPPGILSELYLDATRDERNVILARLAEERPFDESAPAPDESVLIRAARELPPDKFVTVLSRLLSLPAAIATRIVADASGDGLAILCKGARLSRLTHSTICTLLESSPVRVGNKLDRYEHIPPETAARMLRYWRSLSEARVAPKTAAKAA